MILLIIAGFVLIGIMMTDEPGVSAFVLAVFVGGMLLISMFIMALLSQS